MKRAGRLFDEIADWENLRWAVYKALRHKRDRADARAFVARLEENLQWMRARLYDGTFPVGCFHQFTIYDPKERRISAPCFRERVLHHAIMNVCEPVFERWLIPDTYACRCGKGRIAAVHRAAAFARRYPSFVKLDIRKYFDSVPHAVLKDRLRRLFKDPRLLCLLDQVIDGFGVAPGRGLPIGSLTSQHFANFYLGWFDRFAKEQLHVSAYVRYMDDCGFWDDDRHRLRDMLAASTDWLASELLLTVKPHPYLNRTGHGMDFLGARVYPTHVTLNRRSRTRFARKLRWIEGSLLAGTMDEDEAQVRATALIAFATAGGTRSCRFRRRVLQRMPVSGQGPQRTA